MFTTSTNNTNLNRFGIEIAQSGAHLARTMMFDELSQLFEYVDETNASKDEYQRAIEIDNCLGKRSGSTRKITKSKLTLLYGLDPNFTVFRTLRYLWRRDEQARSLLALLCALVRDRYLRLSIPVILQLQEGEIFKKEHFEEFIERLEPNRYSKITLESIVSHLSSSWTQTGHLIGKYTRIRSRVTATPGSVAYALFLGYLLGVRGKALFETEYIRILECQYEHAVELAEIASRRGWIVMKRVRDVIEVQFPNFLTQDELRWVYEQA